MPYLQLDVNGRHAVADKQRLAGRLCATYARLMAVDIRRITVAIRECGDGSVWRMVDGMPEAETSVGAMVVATPVLLARSVERLKARSSRSTVLIDEGDLTRLLPKLRLGELDLFVGRLEPGYAAPDLETEVLYEEPMAVVVRPGRPLAAKRKPKWADIAALPCVMPPPWASLRVKLDQMFYAEGLHPPADIVESASFLSQITFLHQRGAVAFMARSVARHFAGQGMVAVLRLEVTIELPPVAVN